MKKLLFCWLCCLFVFKTLAQNVGIGTTTPTGPLSFASSTGNKIVLWGTGSQAHIGKGVGPANLQIYTQNNITGIAFGHGHSTSFTERVLITNSGFDAMKLHGRLNILSGDPQNENAGGGVWLYKPDNSAALAFIGTQNNRNIGFYGGSAGWGFTYDVINSRVGIGNSTPVVPLDVGGTNGWDLVNGEGDLRLGNEIYRLKMGVALGGGGAGATGIMQAGGIGSLSIGAGGKYLMELNGNGNYLNLLGLSGGLRIGGNPGAAGQALKSMGGGAAPIWATLGRTISDCFLKSDYVSFFNVTNGDFSGLTTNFNLPAAAKVLVWLDANIGDSYLCNIGPCHSSIKLFAFVNGHQIGSYALQGVRFPNLAYSNHTIGPIHIDLAAEA